MPNRNNNDIKLSCRNVWKIYGGSPTKYFDKKKLFINSDTLNVVKNLEMMVQFLLLLMCHLMFMKARFLLSWDCQDLASPPWLDVYHVWLNPHMEKSY